MDAKDSVRDHYRINGEFRRLALSVSNGTYYCLKESILKGSVLFHNLCGYDSHFLIEYLAIGEYINMYAKDMEFAVISTNTERYQSTLAT